MFISLNELKGLIIDIDTIHVDDTEWLKLNATTKLLFVSTNISRLDGLRATSPQFSIFQGSIGMFTAVSSLCSMFSHMGLHSYEIAIITGSFSTVKCLSAYPFALIRYTDSPIFDYNEACYLADYLVYSIDDINSIIDRRNAGYISEAASAVYGCGTPSPVASLISAQLKKDDITLGIISGGRYYNTGDSRSLQHPFSQRITRNKKESTREDQVFQGIYNALCNWIDGNIQHVDGITRIPPRPNEPDRFEPIINRICGSSRIENHMQSLICSRVYRSQKGLGASERATNVSGVFTAFSGVRGKHIVLIDDVISTATTASEAAKVLYNAGASRVTVLVLGINQLNLITRDSQHITLKCSCGSDMRLRFNRYNHSVFWGCSNYPNCTKSLTFAFGLSQHNIMNEISIDQVNDLFISF